jgi:DNA-binding MarR family transcriptional regulator
MLIETKMNHIARRKAGLSWIEYGVADLIKSLSKNTGWCDMSRNKMAEEIGVSKPAICGIIDRLEDKEVVQKNGRGHTKLTSKFKLLLLKAEAEKQEYFANIGKESLPKTQENGKETLPVGPGIGKESLPQSVKKVYQGGKESLPDAAKIGKESLPNTIYTIVKEEKREEQQHSENSFALKSDHEYEVEAAGLIVQKIQQAPRPVKDKWNRQLNRVLAYGYTGQELIRDCAQKMIVKHQDLKYQEGKKLYEAVERMPARIFQSHFGNSWLPNIRPKPGATVKQIPRVEHPTVLPTAKNYMQA